MQKRFWEIDALRGIAIVMMIVFHLLFDLAYFGKSGVSVSSGFWLVFARITATIFIFLVGVSLTLSYSRAKKRGTLRFRKYLFRGLQIFAWGLVITAVTMIFIGQGSIFFGILHFIGISIIVAYLFIRFRLLNLVLGILLIIFGNWIKEFTFDFPWLMWLGLQPANLYSFDYFPMLPWFGVVLLGIFFGNTLYKDHKRRFKLKNMSKKPAISWLSYLGRKSLIIYLVHQPVLVLLLYLFVL